MRESKFNESVFVHYIGWNNRYDQWVKLSQLVVEKEKLNNQSKRPNLTSRISTVMKEQFLSDSSHSSTSNTNNNSKVKPVKSVPGEHLILQNGMSESDGWSLQDEKIHEGDELTNHQSSKLTESSNNNNVPKEEKPKSHVFSTSDQEMKENPSDSSDEKLSVTCKQTKLLVSSDDSEVPKEVTVKSHDPPRYDEDEKTNKVELTPSSSDESENGEDGKTDKKRKFYRSRCRLDWFSSNKVDENGDKVNTYLRPVESDKSKAFCCLDNTTFSVKNRGWATVRDHIKSKRHKSAVLDAKSKNTMGKIVFKNLANSENTRTALMKLLLFSTCHGVGFDNIDHLVKTCREAFPDSIIAQEISMKKTSATYHLQFGIARTERDKVCHEISKNPFSASLDTGSKGKLKRTEVVIRYFSEEVGQLRVVEKTLFVIKSNHETASHVSDSLLEKFEKFEVDLEANLVMIHADNCSVMRGKKTGVLRRISSVAPQVLDCDIGGDGLHHVTNAEKKSFRKVFMKVIKFLDNVKYDIGKSPAKMEDYLEACDVVGDSAVIPSSFCKSRFLDRYEAINDRIDHIDSLREYYRSAKIPRKRKIAGESKKEEKSVVEHSRDNIDNVRYGVNNYGSDGNSEDDSVVDSDFNSDDTDEDELTGNPSARVEYMKKVLDDDHIVETEFKLLVSLHCLKPGYDFLRIFQSKDIKVHLLYEAYLNMLKEVLLEICDSHSLQDSKGNDLSGKELKLLKLETEEEKKKRKLEKEEDKFKKKLKTKKDKGEAKKQVRYGMLVHESKILLVKTVREKILAIVSKYSLGEEKIQELMERAKSKRYLFLVELAKNLQHFLPLEKDFLRWLKYICPKKFVESEETEAYVVKIAQNLPSIDKDEEDDLRQEVRMLKSNKVKYFDEEYNKYVDNFVPGFKKSNTDLEPVKSIDKIWVPIILNKENFPVMSRFLKSTLSVFHGTASVEGAINITRNLLGDRSHRLTDTNLESKKIVKSAVREAPTTCCFDHDISGKAYHTNWDKSWEENKKNSLMRISSDCSDNNENQSHAVEKNPKEKTVSINVLGNKCNEKKKAEENTTETISEEINEEKISSKRKLRLLDKETKGILKRTKSLNIDITDKENKFSDNKRKDSSDRIQPKISELFARR